MVKLIKEIVPKSSTYYVAVSMGVDSVAAYWFLRGRGYKVIPIHFHHRLRPQNDTMIKNFIGMTGDTQNYYGYSEHKLTTEEECRKARIEFFSKHIPAGGTLITAHHLDDYVESYLLNCFRGKPSFRPMNLVSDFGQYKVIHPFLLTEKSDFRQYMGRFDHKIKDVQVRDLVVEDETNTVVKGSRRNWIRNIIVPAMVDQKISMKKYCRNLIVEDIAKIDDNIIAGLETV